MGVVYILDLCMTLTFDLYVDVKDSTYSFDLVFGLLFVRRKCDNSCIKLPQYFANSLQ